MSSSFPQRPWFDSLQRWTACLGLLSPSLLLAASYSDAVKADLPVGYYRFNDSLDRPSVNVNLGSLGAAGNATNLNLRTMSGAIVGSKNAGAYFDSTARTIIPWNAALNPDSTQSFTIEAWFCPTSDKVAGNFVGPAPIMNRYSYPGANRQGWVYFQRNPDSRGYGNNQSDVGWNFRTYKGTGGSTGISVTTGVPYKLGEWQHVVTVWEADTKTAIMYVDGQEAARQTYTGEDQGYVANTDDHDPGQAVNGPAGLSIGSYNNTEPGSNPFRGGIDEVALYDKALSAEQILAHYENAKNAARTISYPDLIQQDQPVGYWRLDDDVPGGDVAVNMGLLQNGAHGANSAEVRGPVSGALAGSTDGAVSYHWRNGTSTTSIPFNGDMNPEASLPFTVELWVKPTSDRQNPGACVVNNRYVKSGNRTGWVIFQRAPNASYAGVGGFEGVGWNFRMYTGAGGSGQDVVSNVPYTVGEWQHIVVTWDGTDPETGLGLLTMYVNGTEVATKANTVYTANTNPPEDGDPANAADLAIGAYNAASGLGNNPFEGDVDEFAFYPVRLTPEQIQAHYEAGIDPALSPSYPNLVLTAGYEIAETPAQALQPVTYFRFDAKAPFGASNTGTANENAQGIHVVGGSSANGPQAPAFPGFESANNALASVGKSWVSLENPSVLNISGQITVEAWVNPDATQGAIARIVSHGPPTLSAYVADANPRDGAILSGNELFLKIDGNGTDYVFGTSDGVETNEVRAAVPAGDLGSGSWVHLVGTYDGSKWSLYRNGSLLASANSGVGALSVDNGGWGIGSTGNGWEDYFAGAIDEVAIYGTALTPTQIAAHYAAASGATTAELSIARAGANVVITYSGGVLQSATSVNGPFSDVNGASSPLSVAPAGTVFYRLR